MGLSCGLVWKGVCEEIAGDWWRLERSRVDVPFVKHNYSFVPVSQVSQGWPRRKTGSAWRFGDFGEGEGVSPVGGWIAEANAGYVRIL